MERNEGEGAVTGREMRKWRKGLRLTQEALAKVLGSSRFAIAQAENSKKGPTGTLAMAIEGLQHRWQMQEMQAKMKALEEELVLLRRTDVEKAVLVAAISEYKREAEDLRTQIGMLKLGIQK